MWGQPPSAVLGRMWVGHSCPTPLTLLLVLAFCFSYQPVMPSGEETHVGTAALGCPRADVGRTLLSDAFDLASGSCFLLFLSTCHAEWRRNSCGDSRPRLSSGGCGSDTPVRRL